jgi:hypothetical protein
MSSTRDRTGIQSGNRASNARILGILMLVINMIHFGCASYRADGGGAETITKRWFSQNCECSSNSTGKVTVCTQRDKVQPGNPSQPIRFFVYDEESKQVVFEDSLDNGVLRWIDDHRFEVEVIPEVISDGERRRGYVYDITSHQRIPLN